MNKQETFTFDKVPQSVAELQSLSEYSLDTPFKTAALAMLVLLRWESDPEGVYQLIDALRGPDPLSNYGKSFIKERLTGKTYKVKSFFAGATVENGYTPTMPLTITVSDNPYSYPDPNWATLYLKSAGADTVRPIKFRKKPSTGQWFLNDYQNLSDIRVPAADDPWA